ncbi:MAG: IS21 family transposase, partial [Myxococcota bacterium]
MTTFSIELLHRGQRVASHRRAARKGAHTTDAQHMPKSHRKHLEWSPSRILNWAASVGPYTQRLAKKIMESRPHPEMGYRSCLGILRLDKRYGSKRLEAACARALEAGATSYRHVAAVLKNGIDR